MQEREAKLLFEACDLKSVIVEPTEKSSGWTIAIVDTNENRQFLVSKRSNDPRLFKTTDAALRCCNRIGFNQVEVKL